MEFVHKSILLDEVIENLNIREDGCYVDGTLGGAGHSYQICTHLGEKGRLVGIDQDADAIQAANIPKGSMMTGWERQPIKTR